MAGGTLSHVEVVGIAGAVPRQTQSVKEIEHTYPDFSALRFEKNAGVQRRHVSRPDQCTSDLCIAAAEPLLAELGWERASIDLLVFVTTSPDYFIPATACAAHRRLDLPPTCAALDVPHGCSGYLHGLWAASSMIAAGQARRVLLLVGETTTRFVSPQDSTLYPLVGDGGSATALTWSDSASPMHFDMRANGRGLEHLWIKAGAYRHPSSTQTRTRTERQGPGVVLSDEDLAMDGQEIFAFTLKEVPAVFRHVMGRAGWSMHDVDAVIMHQANRFMIRTLAKKMQVPAAKMIECLAEFGNTSSASIPLAVVSSLRERARRGPANLVLLAFGAGLSWGGVTLACGPLAVPPLVTVDEGTGG